MLADIAQKDAVKAMKDNATRYIKTTSRALVEHLCKYLAMRIALDLAKTTSAASTQGNLWKGIVNWSGADQYLVQSPKKEQQFQQQFSFISTWKKTQFLQTIFAISGFNSENNFWKESYIENPAILTIFYVVNCVLLQKRT